ncbi:hypothetical protein RIF29_05700 [Crotalaria pallida]|uniref:Uncharacterized protein n=1 Tax=Crotalaria pallida TaxID=3830 RepID=A0AAN9J4Y3_CROPI
MGCCFSTSNSNTKEDQNNIVKNQQSHAPKPNETHEPHNTSSPSPHHVEEETVKEVLSETPISKPHQVPILMPKTDTQMINIENGNVPIMNKPCSMMSESFSEEVSQIISETCSISESFSTTTTTTATTVPEKRDDEATSKRTTGTWDRKKRSYAVDGNRIGARERRHKSPAKMPEKRIPASSPAVRRREYCQLRRDPGDCSRRRSMSPSSSIMGGSGGGRSRMKQLGGAGRRLPPVKHVEDEKVGEESLENPHVSLECFIFL